MFIVLLASGTLFILMFEKPNTEVASRQIWFLVVAFVAAAIRINAVGSISGTSAQTQSIQSALTIISIALSALIASRLNLWKMNLSLLIASGICFLPISFDASDLFDYYQKDSFSLGVLNYDSYQSASQIVGFFALSLTAFTISKRRNFFVYALSLTVVGLSFYTITLSPARGEAIALMAAILILFISGSRWNLLVLAIAVLSIATQNFLDTNLGSRLSEVASGDYGERDYLFSLAIKQFSGNVATFLLGDGLNGYQYHNMLPAELYPHNFLLEGAVSGGLFFVVVLVMTYIQPIVRMFFLSQRTPEQSLALSLMVFLVLIYMKSGTLISLWGLGAYTALFIRLPNSNDRSINPGDQNPAGVNGAVEITTRSRISETLER